MQRQRDSAGGVAQLNSIASVSEVAKDNGGTQTTTEPARVVTRSLLQDSSSSFTLADVKEHVRPLVVTGKCVRECGWVKGGDRRTYTSVV
jgi:hypothetical protein